MRSSAVLVSFALLVPSPCRAADPDPAAALFSAASIHLVGFVVGGALLATSQSDSGRNNAGWLTIESGFTLAPFAAHGIMREWGRGALFAAVPACALGTTGGIFASDPGAVERGGLPEQRWMWGLFGVGLFASAAGVVDAMLAPGRSPVLRVEPAVAVGQLGLRIGGTL